MSPSEYQEPDIKTPPVEVVDPNGHQSDTAVTQFKQYWLQFQRWFDTLPVLAKGAVAIALVFVSLSLLTKVLHLVASIISVGISALILYGLYRIFLKPDRPS
ncbi:MAG: hypothetical protein RLZZ490_1291 [Cyanobacteriota bacterium]|jgi:hypothetical protein